MSYFKIDTNKAVHAASMLDSQAKSVQRTGDAVDSVRNVLSIQGYSRAAILSALGRVSTSIKSGSNSSRILAQSLRQIASGYLATDNRLAGISSGNGIPGGNGSGGKGGSGIKGGQKGKGKSSSVYSPDPVNLNIGNFILDNLDMEIPGAEPLALTRFYNSMGGFTGMLGSDWNLGFEVRLSLKEESESGFGSTGVSIMFEDGHEEFFAALNDNSYVPVSGTTAELSHDENGYQYLTLDGDTYFFDENGRLIRNEDPHHIGFTLHYDGNRLVRVEKDTGEFYSFTCDDNGQLTNICDHTGRVCTYEFEEGHLTKVTLPDGAEYRYTYGENGKIRTVRNPLSTLAVETEYDDQFRTVFQKFSDGTVNSFEYLDDQDAVVMTERNGTISIHYHNELFQNIRNVYPDGEERFVYNKRGQKTQITDKLGNEYRIRYDDKGNVTGVIRPDGTRFSATYDSRNRLVNMSVNGEMRVKNIYNKNGDLLSEEDGIGRKTEYSYDETGRLIKIVQPDSTQILFSYDSRGNMTKAFMPDGGIIACEYDALNRLVLINDALGHSTSYEYDLMGRTVAEVRADGTSRKYCYDAWGNTVSVIDYDGSETKAVYNGNNKPILIIDPEGRETSYEYDSMWNVTKAVAPNGSEFNYFYDENNRLETICDANGNETHYSYDAMGNILTETDEEGNVTSYEWDSAGRRTRTILPDGSETIFGYDAEDHLIYLRDAEGTELNRTFDAAGQLLLEKDSLGRTREYTYNMLGELLSVIDETGLRTGYRYLPGTDLISAVVHPDGTKEEYCYDLNGNVISYTDIYGKKLCYEYDLLDRLTMVRGDRGLIMTYCYDPMDRIISETDCDGNTTKYEYTRTGQLASLINPQGTVTGFVYDPLDELIEVKRGQEGDPHCTSIRYQRDSMGHIVKLTDPLGDSETYEYTPGGRMSAKVDRDGYRTEYTYNSLGLLQSVMWADKEKADYAYSPLHRLVEVNDLRGKTEFNYDAAGNLLLIRYPDRRETRFTYDSKGNRTAICYPDGQQVSYEYDSLNRPVGINYNEQKITYAYNPNGQIHLRELPDQTKILYDYDENGFISRMRKQRGQEILGDISFGYDRYGRRNQFTLDRNDTPEDNGEYRIEYDPAGHIKDIFKNGQLIREYSYDDFGSRTGLSRFCHDTNTKETTEYQYDLRGGLVSMTSSTDREDYRYDKRGNLTELLKNGKSVAEYHYGPMNRLAGVKLATGEEASYLYDGLGFRVGKNTITNKGTKNTSYTIDYSRLYDNMLEIREEDLAESYVWGIGLEGYRKLSGQNGWFITDPLGSVLTRTDQNGIHSAVNYDEFGNRTVGSKFTSAPSQAAMSDSFGYNGFLFDGISGTYYAQARQYRSYTGTFDAMDRFGGDITLPETMNPYVYCIQDPFSLTDKTAYWFGLDDLIAAGVGAVGGMAGQLVSDVIDGATTGKWEFKWQDYAGSAIGGAAGGVTTLYAGPIAGGAVAGGVTRLSKEGLTYISNPKGYTKSGWDVVKETAIDAGFGALSGAVSKYTGKLFKKMAGSKLGQKIAGGLKNKGGLLAKFGERITDIANGKSWKSWSQMSKFLKNQHVNIAASDTLKKKLYKVLLHGIPTYLLQSVLGKIHDKLRPSKVLWDKLKKILSDWVKDKAGLNKSPACAAATP